MSPARPLLTLALLSTAVACRYEADPVDGTVLVIVMDGVRLEESLGDSPSSATGEDPWRFMPRVWDELVPDGVRATQAWNIGVTTTTPAHVAAMSGRRLAVTNYPVDGEPGLYRPELPVLPELVRKELGSAREEVVVMANTELVKPTVHSLWPGGGFIHSADFVWVGQADNEDQPANDDRVVLRTLQGAMAERPLRFALLNLHQVDRSGHYGDEEDYLDDVRWLDDPIADLWAWIQDQPAYADDTWLLLLADHGRHTAGPDDPPWRHHGCACNGCRRVPFLLLGPGVKAGETWDEPVLLTDVAPTMAALWGLEMPFADGLVQAELFGDELDQPSRTGVGDLAVAGGHTATVELLDDPSQRSELSLDGDVVSSPDAIAVEAPAMTALGEDQAWLCFRELTLEPDAHESLWRPRCLGTADGGLSWQDLGSPEDAVGPHWQPVLQATDSGELLVAYPRNLNGTATAGAEGEDGEVSIDLARYRDGDWSVTATRDHHTFPTDPSAVLDGDRLLVAFGAGSDGPSARHERDVLLGEVALEPEQASWSELVEADLDQPSGARGWWRLERPALRVAKDGSLLLAANGFVDRGSMPVLARSTDGGRSWEQTVLPAVESRIMPHVSPVWLDDVAVWATVDATDGAARLCSASLDEAPQCLEAGSPRVLRLAADGDSLHAIVDGGVGAWELRSWGLDQLR